MGPSSAAGRHWIGAREAGAVLSAAIVFVMLAVRTFRLVQQYAVNVLFKDQWKFDDATLFQQHSLWAAFRWQHGPHRQGVGAILQLLLEPAIRWNSRTEAFGIAVILCSSALLALFLKRRLFGSLEYSDVVIPLFFLTPVQYQVLLDSANPSHGPLPLFLSLLYCLAWTLQRPLHRYTGVLCVNGLMIYTGFGLFMGLVTVCLLAIHYWRFRGTLLLFANLFALISLASFFIGYKFLPAVDCFSPKPSNPVHYLLFVAFMFSTYIGIQPVFMLVPAILAGSILLFLFLLVCWKACVKMWLKPSRDATIICSLLLYSLFFCFSTAYGRLCLGLSAAQGSRYMSYLTPAFFGAYLAALHVCKKIEKRVYLAVLLVLALLSSARVGNSDRRVMANLYQGRKVWVDCYLSTRDVSKCDAQARLPICFDPEPSDIPAKLDFLERHRLNLFADK